MYMTKDDKVKHEKACLNRTRCGFDSGVLINEHVEKFVPLLYLGISHDALEFKNIRAVTEVL